MIGVELFSGVGGLALGAHWAGVKTKVAVEKDFHAAQTYAKNLSGTTVVIDDIKEIKQFDIGKKHINVLFGGPPCQGYSSSNQKTRTRKNPINWLFQEYLRCVEMIMPDWVVIENVKGFAELKKGMFLKHILKGLDSLKYTINYKVLNACDYGVPQNRERVFIVASRHGIAFEFPEPVTKLPITVGEAISDLPVLKNGSSIMDLNYRAKPKSEYQIHMKGKKKKVSNNLVTKNSQLVLSRYKHIPQGGNWKNIPAELMSNYKDSSRCHHGIYRRLSEKKPSVVIGNYRKNMLIHPTQDRGLSVREAARLQSFPDWFEFTGPLISQ